MAGEIENKMNEKNRKQLAKVAYLYYIEEKNQEDIAKELGVYRTTVSRMLTKARMEGIVKIEIKDFDTNLFQLESYIREKYHLKQIDIVPNNNYETHAQLEEAVAGTAAATIRQLLTDDMKVGISWGRALSKVVELLNPRQLKGVTFFPMAGGPSHINARYHVNTLVYEMARKFQGDCSFVNAIIVQENKELASGIMASKYFESLRQNWQDVDLAIVGVGGHVDEANKQWLDMLTKQDFEVIAKSGAVGEICCRFMDADGQEILDELNERTIAIPFSELKAAKNSMAIAYGEEKVAAILAVLRKGYVNHLVTDYDTIMKVLALDKDTKFSN